MKAARSKGPAGMPGLGQAVPVRKATLSPPLPLLSGLKFQPQNEIADPKAETLHPKKQIDDYPDCHIYAHELFMYSRQPTCRQHNISVN